MLESLFARRNSTLSFTNPWEVQAELLLDGGASGNSGKLVTLNLRKIALVLGAFLFLLLTSSLVVDFYRILALNRGPLTGYEMIGVAYEHNVPTMFSALLLLGCSGLLAVIAAIVPERTRVAPKQRWVLLSAIFLVLAFDEAIMIHEHLGLLTQFLGVGNDGGLFFYSWTLPGTIIVVGLAVFFYPLVMQLPGRTRRGFFLAGGLFVGGALGSEMVQSFIDGRGAFDLNRMGHIAETLLCHLEEGMEMAGSIVFLCVLLDYIRSEAGFLRVQFNDHA